MKHHSFNLRSLILTMVMALPILIFYGCVPKTYLSIYSSPDFNPISVRKVAIVLKDLNVRDSAVFGEIFIQTAIEKNKFFLEPQEYFLEKEVNESLKKRFDALLEVAMTHSYRGDLTRSLPTSTGAYVKLIETQTGRILWNMSYGFRSYDIGTDAPMVEEVMRIVAEKLIESIPLQYVRPTEMTIDQTDIHHGNALPANKSVVAEDVNTNMKVASLSPLIHTEIDASSLKKGLKDEPAKIPTVMPSSEISQQELDLKKRTSPNGNNESIPFDNYFSVQVGAFLFKENADNRIALLRREGFKPCLIKESDAKKRVWYIAHVGKFSTREEAQNFAKSVKAKTDFETSVRLFDGR